eukprot:6208367-Pleurochrysis_carterae.AAC.3
MGDRMVVVLVPLGLSKSKSILASEAAPPEKGAPALSNVFSIQLIMGYSRHHYENPPQGVPSTPAATTPLLFSCGYRVARCLCPGDGGRVSQFAALARATMSCE